MHSSLLVVASAIALMGQTGGGRPAPTGTPSELRLPQCSVSLIDTFDVQVPAEVAGMLVELGVREGMPVAKGAILGKIDDRKAQAEYKIAQAEQKVAQEQATNDINARYAKAAYGVLWTEWQQALEANKKQSGVFTNTEINKYQLQAQKSKLEIEKSEFEQNLQGITAQARGEQVKAAWDDILRHQIVAPFDGLVLEISKQAREWVQPGEPVVRVVNMERMRVEGFVDRRQFNRWDIIDKPVTVEAEFAGGRKQTFPGKIVYVKPEVEGANDFRVWAEVKNRPESGQWLLDARVTVDMTIHVNERPVAAK